MWSHGLEYPEDAKRGRTLPAAEKTGAGAGRRHAGRKLAETVETRRDCFIRWQVDASRNYGNSTMSDVIPCRSTVADFDLLMDTGRALTVLRNLRSVERLQQEDQTIGHST